MREDVRRRIEEISKNNGGKITPDMVLKDAADENSPLHGEFEWDDAKAGHAYRIITARNLIRSIRITYDADVTFVVAPAYVRDPRCGSDEQGYVEVMRIRSNEEITRGVLVDEFVRVRSALIRARELASVFNLVPEIDEMIDRLSMLKARIMPEPPSQHPS